MLMHPEGGKRTRQGGTRRRTAPFVARTRKAHHVAKRVSVPSSHSSSSRKKPYSSSSRVGSFGSRICHAEGGERRPGNEGAGLVAAAVSASSNGERSPGNEGAGLVAAATATSLNTLRRGVMVPCVLGVGENKRGVYTEPRRSRERLNTKP